MTRVGLVAAVIIIVVASVFFGFRKAAREHAAEDAAAKVTAPPKKVDHAKGTPLEHARSLRKIDPESRKLLLAEIEAARAKRVGSPSSSTSPGESPALPAMPELPLSKEYIQQQMRELVPLVTECYTEAQKADNTLAGKLYVKILIGGEPSIGGLVESSEVDPEQSTITQPGLIECVRETMYGLELVAPAEGGRMKIHYEFKFSPEPSGSSAR